MSPQPGPGWYPDPYRKGWVRWFDGTAWTTHAVADSRSRPDQVVEDDWESPDPDERVRNERLPSVIDLDVPKGSEPAFNGGGGVGGLGVNRLSRLFMRAGPSGPASATRWLVGLTAVLALLAWGDQRHRVLLAIGASIALIATVVVGIRRSRDRARWRDVGRDG